jgi:hypothetical protein
MVLQRLGIAAAVFVGLSATGLGSAFGQQPRVSQHTIPAASRSDLARLSPLADMIYKYVKRVRPAEFKWEQIPWQLDLPEAVSQAKAENRPILMWISSDPPLERC